MGKYSDYEILNKNPLGSGGNAKVFLARKKDSGAKVALKLLKVNVKYFEEKKKRFCIESELVQNIQDSVSGIIPIYDSGLPDDEDKNKYWYVMPLAIPLAEKVNKQSSIEEITECIIDLAKIMDSLHSKKIVHRDIKPSNIYYYNNEFCFGDFGLVDYPEKDDLTKERESVGPKATIAPEMKYNAKNSDGTKADVYSLAKTLWMLLTNNKYGFEGTYDESSKLMGLSNYYKNEHLVEIEELLYDATREEPDLRPSMQEFAQRLVEWMNIKSNFEKSNLSQWKYVQKKLFGEVIPDSAYWSNREDIVKVLNLLGRMPNLNHMFVPSGGGMDLSYAEIATEDGCISINSLVTDIVKPKKLIAENISKDYIWSYFRLELDNLEPILDDIDFEYEELTEDIPGHYIPGVCSEYGYYENNSPLPKGYRKVNRYLRGNYVIFLKTSIYNKIDGTYDARHNKMNTEEFRKYIESLREAYTNKSYLEFKKIANINLFKDEEDTQFKKIDNEIEDAIKTSKYIEDNFRDWNLKSLFKVQKKRPNDKLGFYIKFNPSSSMNIYYLNNDGKLVKQDLFNIDYTKAYVLYNRIKAFELIEKCKSYIKKKCEDSNINFVCYRKLFAIGIFRVGNPTHMFTKSEMEVLLREGNDSKNNYLVIDEDGYLQLLQQKEYVQTYPVRFEGFCAYNNYVGKYSNLEYLKNHYKMALQGWLRYLSSNKSVYLDYCEYKYTEDEILDKIKKYYNVVN